MKTTIRLLVLDILYKLKLIEAEKYADKKCQLSYLIVNEASAIYRRTLLNKR